MPRRSNKSHESPARRMPRQERSRELVKAVREAGRLLLAEHGLIPVPQSWFHSSICLFSVIAFVGALAFVILARKRAGDADPVPATPARFGDGRAIRILAWLTLVLTGLWVAFIVYAVLSLHFYYDGEF